MKSSNSRPIEGFLEVGFCEDVRVFFFKIMPLPLFYPLSSATVRFAFEIHFQAEACLYFPELFDFLLEDIAVVVPPCDFSVDVPV